MQPDTQHSWQPIEYRVIMQRKFLRSSLPLPLIGPTGRKVSCIGCSTSVTSRSRKDCICAYRVTLDRLVQAPVGAVEGPAPLGYVSGDQPAIEGDARAGWQSASAGERAVAIVRLKGYDGQRRAAVWQGRDDLNSVYGHAVLPLLTVDRMQPVHELLCLVYIGSAGVDSTALASQVIEATWLEGGSFRLTWSDGSTVDVPPLL